MGDEQPNIIDVDKQDYLLYRILQRYDNAQSQIFSLISNRDPHYPFLVYQLMFWLSLEIKPVADAEFLLNIHRIYRNIRMEQSKNELRPNDPKYLIFAQRIYEEIGAFLKRIGLVRTQRVVEGVLLGDIKSIKRAIEEEMKVMEAEEELDMRKELVSIMNMPYEEAVKKLNQFFEPENEPTKDGIIKVETLW